MLLEKTSNFETLTIKIEVNEDGHYFEETVANALFALHQNGTLNMQHIEEAFDAISDIAYDQGCESGYDEGYDSGYVEGSRRGIRYE